MHLFHLSETISVYEAKSSHVNGQYVSPSQRSEEKSDQTSWDSFKNVVTGQVYNN